MNGDLRGKMIPLSAEDKLWKGQVRLPSSTQSLDIWGDDNDDITGISLTLGDPDGVCVADRRSLTALPWGPDGSKQVLASMHRLTGEPHFICPRGILAAVLQRYAARGLTPVVATELEFYVMEPDFRATGRPMPPKALVMNGEVEGFQLYDMRATAAMEDYLETIRRYCDAMALPADATTAEFGPGQFEVNLLHRPDAMAAADDCIYLKRVADFAARRHGLKATCMAKPYTEHAGSGLHVHASIIDSDGRNILDSRGGDPTRLKSVTAGLLKTMQEAQLIFAPFANSYRRFQPGSFAPDKVDWGFGHRGTAVRIPESEGPGARVEHRVAGADANPHLLLAAILGGMLLGLDEDLDPGPVTAPESAPMAPDLLTHDFLTAVDRFRSSPFISETFGADYQRIYGDTKRKEAITALRSVSSFDYQTYLPRI
ncbi:glutamine synthetase family protein [Rhizobium sp. SSA_523]|uniref:glutamine synthetase family protein n=1 Tax=Rhizobium sp. SSA_523 TaxID=2952477 RepID=UPI0020918DE2|nr:glutamine synthetase family protein [Rhizobium sp. SSA_523]MCO5730866.1 glutamine synthetase family protein [Rhizobium sp. SSA_523]WKC25857.1 glutamine synthetase family protein [Rhizobium sp. SSA_523]